MKNVLWIESLREELKIIEADIKAKKISPPIDFVFGPVEIEPVESVSEAYMEMLTFASKDVRLSDAFINRVRPRLEAELAKRHHQVQNRVAAYLQPAVAFSKDKNASDNEKKRMDSALERILKRIESEEGDETDK